MLARLTFPAAAIRLIIFPAAPSTGAASPLTRVFQLPVVRLAGDMLPDRLAPFPKLFLDGFFDFRYPFQRLAERLDGVPEPVEPLGNARSKSFSKPLANLLQISSALCSFAFTLATALAISCFAVAS